jgi:PAS domain S-box-containing protein
LYDAVFSHAPFGVVCQKADGVIDYANPAAERLLGLTADQMAGRTSYDPCWRAIHEDGSHFPGDEHPSMVALATGEPVRDVIMGVWQPDRCAQVWIRIDAIPQFRPGDDRPCRVYTTFVDITHCRQAERDLQFRGRAIESALCGLALADLAGRITYVNPALLELWRFATAEDALGLWAGEYWAEPERAAEVIAAVHETGSWAGELLGRRCDGSTFAALVSASLVTDNAGTPIGLCATFWDLSERLVAEDALRRSQAELAVRNEIAQVLLATQDEGVYSAVLAVVQAALASPQGLFGYIDEDGAIVLASLPPGDLEQCRVPGRPMVFPPESWGDTLWGQALRERRARYANQPFKVPAGHLAIDSFLAVPLVHEDRSIGLLAVANRDGGYTDEDMAFLERVAADIAPTLWARREAARHQRLLAEAERQRLAMEQHLQQVAKLESLGVLAGGIAHDFNNLLTTIVGNAGMAREDLPAASPVHDCLQQIDAAAWRAAELCRRMLAYAGQSLLAREPVRLQLLASEAVRQLEPGSSGRPRCELHCAPDLPVVRGDRSQLGQMLQCLLANAAEAVAEAPGAADPRITVSLGVGVYDADELRAPMFGEAPAPGRYVCLEVVDNGGGMEPAVLQRVFEPFFTTKFTGRGLGLPAALGIVRAHHGAIDIHSAPGCGTTVRVLLPVESAPATDSRDQPKAWRGQGTVLVVDDEDNLRSLGRRMLQRWGFGVLTAADGRQALDVFASHRDEIVLVLLDLTMPNLGGEATFDELRRRAPELPILIASGHAEADVLPRFAGKDLTGFVPKPYPPAELQQRLRAILDPA